MIALQALILGIVEGLTEFLPVSSTAHLEIATRVLGIVDSDFVKSFIIIIQLGAILAVLVLFGRRLWSRIELWKRVVVAFIPTGVIGFVLYKIIKHVLLGNLYIVVLTLGVGGIIIILFEYSLKNKVGTEMELEQMSYMTAFWIGVAQSLAVVPGVSRSAATIIAGRAFGLGRRAIVEFSFLLAVPTMLAATGYDLLKNHTTFTADQNALLVIGFVAAFVSALLAIKYFLRLVERYSFTGFGVYRILLAIVLIIFLI